MIRIIVAASVILASFAVVLILGRSQKEAGQYLQAEELPALLQFTYYTQEQWETQLEEICQGRISYRELELLLEKLGVEEHVAYRKRMGFFSVEREAFWEVYDQVVDLLDVEGRVSLEQRIFIHREEDGAWITQKGRETLAPGVEEQVQSLAMWQVYEIDGAVAALRAPAAEEISWENVFVHEAGKGSADILFANSRIALEIPELTEDVADTICDVVWKDGAITAIYKKPDTIQGNVLSYNDREIEIEGYGILEHVENLPVYKSYGTLEELDLNGVTIGNLTAEFVVAGREVCGIVLREPASVEQIRVLLLNGESPYREEVYVTAREAFTVTWQGQQQTLEAGALVRAADYLTEPGGGYLELATPEEEGCLYLADSSGQLLSLGYHGTMEIRRYDQGCCVVNALSLEDYLTAVVPSEMPASYEREALRTQAVCARSYACIQLGQNEYAGFAANVDDTTNYQVYNKQERDERTTLAVQDTVGEVVLYQGEPAETYYYSTSCGFSQSRDVWELAENQDYGYLASVSLLTGEQPELTGEEAFASFIQDTSAAAYDSDGALYRWRAQLDLPGHQEAVNGAIAARREISESQVQIFDREGKPAQMSLADLGKIETLTVEERSSGGCLKKVRLGYEKGSVLLSTEYTIRRVVGEAVTSLTDRQGQPVENFPILPSAAFIVLPVEQGHVLYGGGYGHGIGMSQNGANGMAKAGFTYRDILQTFYQNITIENIYGRN